MRAVFLQSPAAALATAVCISVPAVAPHATEAAVARLDQSSVALSASTSTLTDSIADTLSKLKLVLSPSGSGSELLLLPESIAKQVTDGGINSVPNTFIEAGRTAGANLVSDLNAAASTSALASPLDGLLAAYNALLKFLGVGAQGTGFTSLFSLVQSVGNFLGLPITVVGSLLLGQSANVPNLISTFTNAAQTAIQQFLPSVAATIQAIFGGFGGFGAASALNATATPTLFKGASLDATDSIEEKKVTETGDPAGTTNGITGGTTPGTTEGTTGGTTPGTTGGTTPTSAGGPAGENTAKNTDDTGKKTEDNSKKTEDNTNKTK